jgi:uncharacterized protein (TIGR03000 family)
VNIMNATWKTGTPLVLLPTPVVVVLMALARPEPARAQAEKAPAAITVLVPADAEIFFDGIATTQKGAERLFVSPPLEPGKTFHYDVLALWKQNGETVERTRKVRVSSGARVRVSFVQAADGETEAEGAAGDKQVVRSKASQRPAASSVNFRKELNLPFDSLTTLGSRIAAARRKPDPVALAHAANELAVAEKVSGKTASLTSKELIKESAELAAVRRQEAELKAVYQVASQLQTQEDNLALLKTQIAQAQAQARADKEAFDRNQEPTSSPRKVVVNNYTPQYVDVWVNGSYKAQVLPGQSQVITIEHRWNPTVLTAYGNDDSSTWGPRYVWGRFTKYTWNLN